jgi:hypothetical protein
MRVAQKAASDVGEFLTFLNILSHKQDREIGGGSIGRSAARSEARKMNKELESPSRGA